MKKGSDKIPPFILKRNVSANQDLLSLLDDNLTAAIVAALRANVVIHYSSAAVRASCQCRHGSYVVGSSFVSALLGDFSFRMCHFILLLFFNYYSCSFNKFLRPLNGVLPTAAAASSSLLRRAMASGLHSPSGWTLHIGTETQTRS